MHHQNWGWAHLSPEQLAMLQEAERTLGVDLLLAYEPGQGQVQPEHFNQQSLRVAGMNASQVSACKGLKRICNRW